MPPSPRVLRTARAVLAPMLLAMTLATGGLARPLPAGAAPGAHGPNGEHLDASANPSIGRDATPRLEAHSEAYELVARLAGGELSMLIDRYASNEPVLGARVRVRVSLDGRDAEARFHPDHGDYAVDDPALIAALSQPGEHALVITLEDAGSSDLIDGVLVVDAPGHDHGDHGGHDQGRSPWMAGGLLGLALLAGATLLLLRRRRTQPARRL